MTEQVVACHICNAPLYVMHGGIRYCQTCDLDVAKQREMK